MDKLHGAIAIPPPARRIVRKDSRPNFRIRRAAFCLIVATLVFGRPLYRLAAFAASSDLYSYILLIPFISGYIGWRERHRFDFQPTSNRRIAVGLFLGAGAVLGAYLVAQPAGLDLAVEDQLALTTTSFLLTSVALVAWFLGRAFVGRFLFPIGLLAFLVPLPSAAVSAIEAFMQYGSATVARLLFGIFGPMVFSQDLNFQLPGIVLRVAPECSGLRSTLALAIVSLVAGYLLLRSRTLRTILAVAVVPLALLRNGFRIFVVGNLCVRLGPQMIDSYIHRQGGPIFFVLSLVPFFALVFFLRRCERERSGDLKGSQN